MFMVYIRSWIQMFCKSVQLIIIKSEPTDELERLHPNILITDAWFDCSHWPCALAVRAAVPPQLTTPANHFTIGPTEPRGPRVSRVRNSLFEMCVIRVYVFINKFCSNANAHALAGGHRRPIAERAQYHTQCTILHTNKCELRGFPSITAPIKSRRPRARTQTAVAHTRVRPTVIRCTLGGAAARTRTCVCECVCACSGTSLHSMKIYRTLVCLWCDVRYAPLS